VAFTVILTIITIADPALLVLEQSKPVVLNRRCGDRCRSALTFLLVHQIYYNFISQLQNARCWMLVHWLKK